MQFKLGTCTKQQTRQKTLDKKVIYFDNAASSHPKPEGVYLASDRALRRGGSPGRSAHRLALEASKEVFETRLKFAEFLGIEKAERLIFTPGCTYSINMAIKGLKLAKGEAVVVSALEHNALIRPLHALKESIGIEILELAYSPGEVLSLADLESTLKKHKVAVCAFLEASNLTGEMLDLDSVAGLCRKFGVPLLIDAAQSAGAFQARNLGNKLSFWCASGHKGFFGPPGIGLLYVSPDIDLEPLIAGGTGSGSEEWRMPLAYPDRLEAGTISGPNIAALGAGLDFLLASGIEKIRAKDLSLLTYFLEWMENKQDKFWLPAGAGRKGTALVSFKIKNMDPATSADLLDREYGICVRAGLHCAASAHRALGTQESGLLRVSFSCFNTESELEQLIYALEKIAERA